ncbi:MAG: hypothetical protein WDA68_00965 [Phycisphaerae bacterium]
MNQYLEKIASIIVAGVGIYAMYMIDKTDGHWDVLLTDKENTEYTILITIGWLICSLGFIWFSEYVSEELEETGGWNPTWLVKFCGWLFLIAPTLVYILYKILEYKP